MQKLWQDLRYGARILLKKPGFTLLAVFTLALGIGANTAILSTVNGFIIRQLPVDHPEELVQPFWGSRQEQEVWHQFSYPNYADLRDQNKVFSGLVAWAMIPAGISDSASRQSNEGGRADIIWGETVSGNYFDVLGVKAALGRTFLPEEDRRLNGTSVIVLGYTFWQKRFNSDPSVVGRTVYLNNHPFTVIGVAPGTFKGAAWAVRQQFWIPLIMATRFGFGEQWQTETGRGWQYLRLLGRLKTGVTIEQAEADLNLIAGNLGRLYPNSNADSKIQVVPELYGRFNQAAGFFKFTSAIALVVAGLVLLVACANVANLLLARAGARHREIGIRLAIGAGRFRIVRQLLMESLLLAALSGAIGLIFAYWGTDLIHASIPPLPYPIDLDFSPDLLVLKWMLVVILLTGMIFGLAPALIASRTDLVSVLKSDAAGQLQQNKTRRRSLRSLLVIAQVAISIVVLVCAGLFTRSLNRVHKADPGFRTDNLITMQLSPGLLGYSNTEGKRFFSELLRRIETQPGVRAASLSLYLPLGNNNTQRSPVLREGEPQPPPNQGLEVEANIVAPRYFETIGTPLVLGRDFNERDNDHAPNVAIVNQEFARRLYGREPNALGKRFRASGQESPLLEIIGVAKDGRYINIYENPRPCIFLPEYQGSYESQMTLLVSAAASSDLQAVAESARREIAQIDSRVPVFGLQMAGQNLTYAFWGPRLAAGLASAFGLLTLVLATMGLYSVMAYAVSRCTREIGIRMALGAQRRDVLKLVIRHGMSLVITGIVIGLIGALSLSRIMSSLLFGVSATDPLSFMAITLLLSLVALAACWVPARRAAKVDPMVALRHD
ncbi:MAG: ABC transporter permease [Acidobacteria bacterium]|nr:ABC transporter permease [Acidobacteriota bacterium]